MHSIESRFVTGPSNILFRGVYVYEYVCTFLPGILQAVAVIHHSWVNIVYSSTDQTVSQRSRPLKEMDKTTGGSCDVQK